MTPEEQLLKAARAVVQLEMDQEGSTADDVEMFAALADLRAAVRMYDAANAPLLTAQNLRPLPWRPV